MKPALLLLIFLHLGLLAKTGENTVPLTQHAQQYLKHQTVQFIENKGQLTDMDGKPVPFVFYKAQAPGIDLYLTDKGLTYVLLKAEEEKEEKDEVSYQKDETLTLEWNRVDLVLKGASIKKENIMPEGQSAYFNQYFLAHCPDGISNVRDYEKLTIREVYPNIDWVLYNSSEKGFKYDFVVHPGADAKDIELVYLSQKPIRLSPNGELQIAAPLGRITEQAPVSFLEGKPIATRFQLVYQKRIQRNGENGYETAIGFDIPEIISPNPTSDLTIDPQLVWATLFGGNEYDGTMAAISDATGNIFAAGYTKSSNFPTKNAGTFFEGVFVSSGLVDNCAFILKFDNVGAFLWGTYYVGSFNDVACDAAGNIFLTGYANPDMVFPTQDAGTFFQASYGGGQQDAIMLKFDNAGNRLWATYYGGTSNEEGYSLTIDPSGNLLVTGFTNSPNFPLQNAGAFFQGSYGGGNSDGFMLKFDNVGNRLWATYYGGSSNDKGFSVASDNTGNAFVTGMTDSPDFPLKDAGTFFRGNKSDTTDALVVKFSNTGNLLWSTYYGGNKRDQGEEIAIDGMGNVFITGFTGSNDFPLKDAGSFFQNAYGGGTSDGFILKFDNNGNHLWATYFGGSKNEGDGPKNHLVIDKCNHVYVSLTTGSSDLGTYVCDGGYIDDSYNGSTFLPTLGDLFLIRFSSSGALNWATYFGGNGSDFRSPMAIDPYNNLFMFGEWSTSVNPSLYPLTNPGGTTYFKSTYDASDDGFAAKFVAITPTLTPSQISPSACACNGMASVSVAACPPLNYYWSNGSSVLNSTLTTSSISNLCQGVYQVTVTSACQFTQTTTFTLTGGAAAMTASLTTSVACGVSTGSVTLQSVANASPNYVIAEGTTTLGINVTTPYTIIGVAAGNHTYKITDALGCSVDVTVTVPNGSFSVTASTSGTLSCAVPTLSLSATGGVTYTWAGPGILSGGSTAIVVVNAAGVYTVTVTGVNGCMATSTTSVVDQTSLPLVSANANGTLSCSSTTVSLSATGNGPYAWAGPGILSGSNTSHPIVNTPGIYTVTVGTGNCVASATTAVVQNTTTPVVSATGHGTLSCLSNTILLVAGSGDSYLWVGPGMVSGESTATVVVNAAGIYTVTVTGTNGCIASATTTVVQNTTTPVPIITGSSTLSCSTRTLSLNGSGGGSYAWAGPGIVSGHNTSPVIVDAPGFYTLTVTGDNGCSALTSIEVIQNSSLPTVSVTSGSPLSCLTPTTLLTVTGANTYSWSGPGMVMGSTTNSLTVNVAGIYSLVATAVNGCTTMVTVSVFEDTDVFYAAFVANPTEGSPPLAVDFTNQSVGATGYSWNFGNGNVSFDKNPSSVFYTEGTYTVVLIATKGVCTSTATSVITLSSGFTFYAPNCISPDDNGINDVFLPKGTGWDVSGFYLTVFNRWGELIYYTNDAYVGWDATYTGKSEKVQDGVYTWKVELKDLSHKKYTYIGHVVVIK